MEALDALNVVEQLITSAQGVLAQTADIGWRLGATITGATLLFAMAVRVAGGGAGSAAVVVQWIISTGLVLGALTFWPTVMQETFATANEVSQIIGGSGVTGLDVIGRGYGLFARIFNAGVQGTIWNPANIANYLTVLAIGFLVFLMHVALSLIVAASILQFWIGGAAVAVVIPFALMPGLSGIGLSAFAFVIGSMLRLIVVAVIVTIGDTTLLEIVIPDDGEALTLIDVVGAFLLALVIAYLAWRASSWASQIARAAPGGTGLTGLITAVAVGAARAGGSGTSGGGSQAGAAGSGGGSAGGRQGTARAGDTPAQVGTQAKA